MAGGDDSIVSKSRGIVTAVAVPVGAVLFHQGRALVYVRLEPAKFQRREVRILGRHGDRYFLAIGRSLDASVIVMVASE